MLSGLGDEPSEEGSRTFGRDYAPRIHFWDNCG